VTAIELISCIPEEVGRASSRAAPLGSPAAREDGTGSELGLHIGFTPWVTHSEVNALENPLN